MQDLVSKFDWDALRRRLESVQGRQSTREIDVGRVLDERAARYRVKQVESENDAGVEYIVFARAGTSYGVEATWIEEVRPLSGLTRLPGISDVVRGLINVRGRIVTVHDLASFTGTRAESPGDSWALMGWGDVAGVALLADDVRGIRRIYRQDIREAPIAMAARGECYRGVCEDGTLVLSLDGLRKDKSFFYA